MARVPLIQEQDHPEFADMIEIPAPAGAGN